MPDSHMSINTVVVVAADTTLDTTVVESLLDALEHSWEELVIDGTRWTVALAPRNSLDSVDCKLYIRR